MKILTLLAVSFFVIASSIGITAIAGIDLMNNNINEISQREIPKINALTTMQILLERAAKNVFSEVQVEVTPEPNDFNLSLQEFKIAAGQYKDLAITTEEKTLLGEMDNLVTDLESTGNKVIMLQQNQSRIILERRSLVNSAILPTIDNEIQSDTNLAAKNIDRERALLEMEFEVQSISSRSNGYVVSRDPVLKQAAYESLDRLDSLLSMFAANSDLTDREITTASVLKDDFRSLRSLVYTIIGQEDEKQELLSKFSDTEARLDQILNGSLDRIVAANILADQNRAAAVSAIMWAAVAIVILSSVALGIFMSRYISRSINDLKERAHKIMERNFDTKSRPLSRIDELTYLSQSFDKMTEELRAQNKLQEQFLSIASHELRSPIHPILNYSNLALEGHMPYEEAIQKIFQQAQRLQQLASDILDVTRIEAGQLDCHFAKSEIGEIILNAVDAVKSKLNDGVSLEVSPLPDIELKIDKLRILQVLINLLDNSVKFTKEGKIEVEATVIGSRLQIKVKDTGEGMPKEILPRLFEKFASKSVAGGTQHGTGLGLFISRAIIAAHNGEISAYNNKDGGSTFVITLPLTPELEHEQSG